MAYQTETEQYLHMAHRPMHKILIVDANFHTRARAHRTLKYLVESGCATAVYEAENARQAQQVFQECQSQSFSVVLIEVTEPFSGASAGGDGDGDNDTAGPVSASADCSVGLVRYIRDTLQNYCLRIILICHGNPPKHLRELDVDGFEERVHLTDESLYMTVRSSIRNYIDDSALLTTSNLMQGYSACKFSRQMALAVFDQQFRFADLMTPKSKPGITAGHWFEVYGGRSYAQTRASGSGHLVTQGLRAELKRTLPVVFENRGLTIQVHPTNGLIIALGNTIEYCGYGLVWNEIWIQQWGSFFLLLDAVFAEAEALA